MSDTITLYTPGDRESLHRAVLRLYQLARDKAAAAGDRVDDDTGEVMPRVWRMSFDEAHEEKSIKQRKFLHGPVLGQITEQARANGEAFPFKVWKEHLREKFLGYKWECVKRPGHKRATPRKIRVSTEDLSVKQYSEYIEKVLAYAATELGVSFDLDPVEREATRYVRPARRAAITQERAPLPLVERVA